MLHYPFQLNFSEGWSLPVFTLLKLTTFQHRSVELQEINEIMNQLLQEMFLLSNPNAIQKIQNVSLAVLNSTGLIPEMLYRRQGYGSADAQMSLIYSSLKIHPQRPNSDL